MKRVKKLGRRTGMGLMAASFLAASVLSASALAAEEESEEVLVRTEAAGEGILMSTGLSGHYGSGRRDRIL